MGQSGLAVIVCYATLQGNSRGQKEANAGLTALFLSHVFLQVTKSERQIMKPLYDRYRLVKQILCRASTIPVIVSIASQVTILALLSAPRPLGCPAAL